MTTGTQYCLSLLCQILGKDYNAIAVEDPVTNWIRFIFERFKFAVCPLPVDKKGYDISALERETSKVVFVTPFHQFLKGKTVPVANRILLLNWAYQNNGIIIEDDYDSEVRYLADSIPSLRISFMILPPKLLELYQKEFYFYEQTTSRLHQKAFTRLIKEGFFESHIQKLKKTFGINME